MNIKLSKRAGETRNVLRYPTYRLPAAWPNHVSIGLELLGQFDHNFGLQTPVLQFPR